MKKIVITIFLLFLFLPALQAKFEFLPETNLNGVTQNIERPSLNRIFSPKGRSAEGWQKEFEQWFNNNLGLRAAAIKTDNQINFHLFKEISSKNNTKIVLGKNNWLFEKGYIDNRNNRDAISDKWLNQQVDDIAALQKALSEKGIPLLLVIAPSKASLYPEQIPPKYLANQQPTNYDRLIPLLSQKGIHYLDGRAILESQKEHTTYSLFPQGGTHWTYSAACLVSQQIMTTLESLSSKDLVNITCAPDTPQEVPYGTDKDLADLINIWTPEQTYGQTAYPTITGDNGQKLDILMIGDSFSWTLINILENAGVYKDRDFYYYFSRNSQFPEGTFDPISEPNINWQTEVFAKDAIILEVSETGINNIGSGFVQEALKHVW